MGGAPGARSSSSIPGRAEVSLMSWSSLKGSSSCAELCRGACENDMYVHVSYRRTGFKCKVKIDAESNGSTLCRDPLDEVTRMHLGSIDELGLYKK